MTLAALHRDPRAFSAVILEAAGFGSPRRPSAKRPPSAMPPARPSARRWKPSWISEQLPCSPASATCRRTARAPARRAQANDAEALARTFEQAGQHVMLACETLETLAVLRAGGTPLLYLAGERDEKYRASRSSCRSGCDGRSRRGP
ncbi:MAG: hypothetical protein ACLSGS_02990 [Adlercreutzia sp.]